HSHSYETTDQSYNEHIDITTGISALMPSSDDLSLAPDNLCFIMDDLHHIPSDDLKEMYILNQPVLLSIRINKFKKRNGRKFPGIHGKTK
ncbi:hypothetical protein R6Q57_001932, partial [Mikania cordata]